MNCNDEGIPAVTTGLIAMVKISDGEYRVAVDGDTNVVYVVDAGNPVIKGLDDAVDYYLYETKAPPATTCCLSLYISRSPLPTMRTAPITRT